MKTIWKRFVPAFGCYPGTSLTACGGGSSSSSGESSEGEDTSLSDIQKRGKLIVGMNAEFAPMSSTSWKTVRISWWAWTSKSPKPSPTTWGGAGNQRAGFRRADHPLNAGQVDIPDLRPVRH